MIDISTILQARYSTLAAWSPDETMIVYALSGVTGYSIMVYSVAEANSWPLVSEISIPRFLAAPIRLYWSKDGENVIYNKMHDYYTLPARGGEPELLVSANLITKASLLSPDLKKLAFIKDGALWTKTVAEGETCQLTGKMPGLEFWGAAEEAHFPDGAWSPDARKIAIPLPTRDICIVSLENKEIKWIDPSSRTMKYLPVWSHDSSKLAFLQSSLEEKSTALCVASVSESIDVTDFWEVADEKWLGVRGVRAPSWSHDNRKIAFVSNKSDWCHLYITSLDTGETKQLTKGNHEIITFSSCSVLDVTDDLSPAWSPDGAYIAFLANKDSPHERHIWTIPSEGGESEKLVETTGVVDKFQWSPHGTYIMFMFSGPTQTASLSIAKPRSKDDAVRVYDSLPKGVNKEDFVDMMPVKYKSADGTMIPGILLTPKDLDKDRKYPAVVFVYGLGFQLALLCHNVPTIEPLLDNYLVQKGYVVMRLDIRGTCWHGKDFETVVHYEAGGADVAVQDVASAAKYLADLGYVDPHRIGLTGLSWGGWMTALTVVQAPDAFSAAIPRAGVYDLVGLHEHVSDMYNQRWGDPKKRLDLYEKWSPAKHAHKLKAAVFIAHGEVDMNAPFSEAKKFVNALMRMGKHFEFMMYPEEPHGFVSVHAYRDFLERFAGFFDKHLNPH